MTHFRGGESHVVPVLPSLVRKTSQLKEEGRRRLPQEKGGRGGKSELYGLLRATPHQVTKQKKKGSLSPVHQIEEEG